MSDTTMSEQKIRLDNLEQALDAVHAVARAVLVPRDLPVLYRTIYQVLATVIPYDAGYIEIFDQARDSMQTVFAIDEGSETFSTDNWNYHSSELISWMVAQRQSLLFGDLHADMRTRFPTAKPRPFGNEEKRSRAWLSVPLLLGERLVGIFNIQSYQPDIYGPFEQSLLEALANPIAVALENARLLSELEHAVGSLKIPLIPLTDNILIVPLVGVLDQLRWERLTEAVLETISAQGCEEVLLDGSGIVSFDIHTVQALTTLVQAIDLIGAHSMLIGLRPSLIEGVVKAGIQLGSIRTARDLAGALATMRI